MNGTTLGAILLGNISRWDHPAIIEQNPSKAGRLPSRPITRVVRRPGSGGTYIYSSGVASLDPAFRSSVGFGSSIPWMGPGKVVSVVSDKQILDAVKSNPNSIGYVSLSEVRILSVSNLFEGSPL